MALRFVLAFTAISFLFTLLSWGHALPQPFWVQPEGHSAGLAWHLLKHALLGGLVALPTRRRDYILAGAGSALLIDVDHLGWLGVPTVSRSSHSLAFPVLIMVTMALLARRGLWGKKAPEALTSVVAGAAVCAHVALDILETQGYFPIWAPMSNQMVGLTEPWALVMFGLAVGAANLLERRKGSAGRYAKAPRSISQHQ